MRTISRFLLGVVAVAVPTWAALRAQPESEVVPTGRVLVLENERLLEGDIERRGDQYCVRRPVGELWLPARKVLKMCASRDDAFMFICSRANLRDPDERLRLARWCHLNGLYEQAVLQAQVAAEMRPTDRATQQLLDMMKRAAETARRADSTPVTAPSLEPTVTSSVDISLESLGTFTNRVQPILMNVCARCHANGQGKEFKLLRTFEGESLNRRATQHNLAAVLAQVRWEQPQLSPFLIRAVSVHGSDGQPPLKGRSSEPYRILQEWVETTVAENPHLQQERSLSSGAVHHSASVGFASGGVPGEGQPQTSPTRQVVPPVPLAAVPLSATVPPLQESRSLGASPTLASAIPGLPVSQSTPAPVPGSFATDADSRPVGDRTPAAAEPVDPFDPIQYPGNRQAPQQ